MQSLVHHMLRDSAERNPNQEALVCGEERLSYAAAWQRCTAIAGGLLDAGLSRLDRIGVYLEPSMALAVSFFGISGAGGVYVPVHHSLFPDQVEHIARDCQMTALVTDATRLQKLRPILKACSSIRFVVVVGEPTAGSDELCVYRLSEWLDHAPLSTAPDQSIDKDLAAILYTSGSTGKPKGVMLSHANIVAGASIVSDYLKITERDRILAVLPLSFDAGLNQLTTAIQQGGTCVLMKFLFAKEIVAMAAKERVTGLAGVPPLWSLIAQESSRLHSTPLPSLRYITNTGGALPLSTLSRLRAALTTTQVVLMYGLTEAFRSTYLPPEELDRRPTSMGKAIPDTEILVLDENGKRCRPGEIGELVHRGPTVSLGYWGKPELTDRILRPNPLLPPEMGYCEKVCYSGDLVKTDEDGFLYFVGRRDNQIKSAGFRISPNEVESVLCKKEEVRDAAVVGVPDEVLGQQVRAFVVPREGETIEPAELIAWAAGMMPRHMVPKTVVVLSELPKTSSGKVNYPALRERECDGQLAGAK